MVRPERGRPGHGDLAADRLGWPRRSRLSTTAWARISGETQRRTGQDLYIEKNPNPVGEKDKLDAADDGSSYSQVHRRFHPYLPDHQGRTSAIMTCSCSMPTGHVLYTVFKERTSRRTSSTGPGQGPGLGEVFRPRRWQQPTADPVFADFDHYAPRAADAPAAFMAISSGHETAPSLASWRSRCRSIVIDRHCRQPDGSGRNRPCWHAGRAGHAAPQPIGDSTAGHGSVLSKRNRSRMLHRRRARRRARCADTAQSEPGRRRAGGRRLCHGQSGHAAVNLWGLVAERTSPN